MVERGKMILVKLACLVIVLFIMGVRKTTSEERTTTRIWAGMMQSIEECTDLGFKIVVIWILFKLFT